MPQRSRAGALPQRGRGQEVPENSGEGSIVNGSGASDEPAGQSNVNSENADTTPDTELRNPPSKGKLPRRSKGALNERPRTQQSISTAQDPGPRKQKALRPDKYEVQASPEPVERRKKAKREHTRQSLKRARDLAEYEAQIAWQLGQLPGPMEEEEEEQPPQKAPRTSAGAARYDEVDDDSAPGDADPTDDAALDADLLADEDSAGSAEPEPSVTEQREEQTTPKKRRRPPKAQKIGHSKKRRNEPAGNTNASHSPKATKSARAYARQKQSSTRGQTRMNQALTAARSEPELATEGSANDVNEDDVVQVGPSRQRQRRTKSRQAVTPARSNGAVVLDPGNFVFLSNGNEDQTMSYDEIYADKEAERDVQEQDDEEPEEEEEEGGENAPMSSNRARISRRLTAIRDSSREPSPEENPQDNFRLFGVWSSLRQIVRAAERHESAMETWEFDDGAVKNAFQTCRNMTDQLVTSKLDLERGLNDCAKDTVEDLWNDLNTLNSVVKRLCGPQKSLSKYKGYERTNAVYGMLFPALVHLLDAVVAFYEYLDVQVRSKPRLDLEHLDKIITLAKTIMGHGKSGRGNLDPDPSFPIKQSVHKRIILALDILATALSEQHATIQAERDFRLEQRREDRRRTAQEARDEIIYRREQHLKRLVNKWEVLHMVRERMYPDFRLLADRATRAHLAYPRNSTDVDADGIPYIAERVFAPRVGPSPSAVQHAEAQAGWPKEHVHALVWGLQEFAGPSVIEDVIKAYCGLGGPLSPYNVTEIVVKTAYWRERLIKRRWEEGRVVEEWIRGIPVWTKRHEMSGEENREPVGARMSLVVGGS